MGDDDNGAAIVTCEVHQDPLYVGAGDSIEIAGRLIGQDQQWVIGERAGDRNPLALSTRKLPRKLPCFARETETVEQLGRARSNFRLLQAAQPLHRQHHVFQSREFRQQKMELEDETDFGQTQAGERAFLQG